MLLRVDDVRGWASTDPAVGYIAYWVARLLRATCTGIETITFPAGKKAKYWPDTDGVLLCNGAPEFVPTGLSVWEVGLQENVEAKAESDFNKRSAEAAPRGHPHNELAFVFVTAYDWARAEAWVKEKRAINAAQPAERQWRSIHVITAQQLTMWISMVPWIELEFMREELGRDVSGLATVEMEFDEYKHMAGVRLPPSFVVCNRIAPRDSLLAWLAKPGGGSDREIFLAADTILEGRHFIAAAISGLPEGQRAPLMSRVVFVDKDAALLALHGLTKDNVLVAADPALQAGAVKCASAHGCKLIILQLLANAPGGAVTALRVPRIMLEPPATTDMVEQLLSLGVEEGKARQIAAQHRGKYNLIRDALTM